MAEIGNRHAVEVLLQHGANINARDAFGRTPLDVAVRHDLPRMVRFLRKRGAESAVTERDGERFHPIKRDIKLSQGRFSGEVAWYRADRGYGYLRDSLREGSRDGVPDGKDVYGELFFDRDSIVGHEPGSVEEGTSVSFEVIQDKFGLRAADVEFGTIDAFLYSYCGQTEILRLALSEGADLTTRVPLKGSTHLHNICCCRQGLRRPKRDDKQVIRDGWWNDEPWIAPLKLAIEAGCDVNSRTNVGVEQEAAKPWQYNGETPLHLASASWALNLVQELLAAGADKSICNANARIALSLGRTLRGMPGNQGTAAARRRSQGRGSLSVSMAK